MPRDNRRRGRHSKNKNDNKEDDPNMMELGQRRENKDYDNINFEDNNAQENFNNEDYDSAFQDLQPCDFGLPDPNVISYLKQMEEKIDTLLQKTSVEKLNEEQREEFDIIIANIFEEIKGHEFTLIVHHEGSVFLEKFLKVAPQEKTLELFKIYQPRLLSILCHRFGSHVIQTIITLSADIIDLHVKGEFKPSKDTSDPMEEIEFTIEDIIVDFCDQMTSRWSAFIFDPFASHVLRILLQVLVGKNLDTDSQNQNASTTVRSKKSAKYLKEHKAASIAEMKLKPLYRTPPSFKKLLNSIFKELVEDINETVLRNAVLHKVANPAIQLLLKILHHQEETKKLDKFVDRLLMGLPGKDEISDELEQVKKQRNPFVDTILKDQVGTHLMEIIVRVVSPKLFKKIYRLYFKHRLLELSLHYVSNFVIQQLITNMPYEPVFSQCLEELGGNFDVLLRNNKTGTIKSCIEACVKLNCQFEQLNDYLVAGFKLQPETIKDILPCIIYLRDYPTYSQSAWDQLKFNTQGSTIIQALTKFPDPHNIISVNSFLNLSPETKIKWSKDIIASHAIDSFFTSPNISIKAKRKMIRGFDSQYDKLALDKFGSRVLDKCFEVADIEGKQRIVKELLPSERVLNNDFFGKITLRNCHVQLFKTDLKQWIQVQQGLESKRSLLKDILEDSGPSKKIKV